MCSTFFLEMKKSHVLLKGTKSAYARGVTLGKHVDVGVRLV